VNLARKEVVMALNKNRASKLRRDTLNSVKQRNRHDVLKLAQLVYKTDVELVRDGKKVVRAYYAWGYETHEQYVMKELGMEPEESNDYCSVWKAFGIKVKKGYTRANIEKVSIRRLSVLALGVVKGVITTGNVKDWLDVASETSEAELRKELTPRIKGGRTAKTGTWVLRTTYDRLYRLRRRESDMRVLLGTKDRDVMVEAAFNHYVSNPPKDR
jgi:hypothetical protein